MGFVTPLQDSYLRFTNEDIKAQSHLPEVLSLPLRSPPASATCLVPFITDATHTSWASKPHGDHEESTSPGQITMKPCCCNFMCPLPAPSRKLPESVRGCRRESRRRQPSEESWGSCRGNVPASFHLLGPPAGELALLGTPALWLTRALATHSPGSWVSSPTLCRW